MALTNRMDRIVPIIHHSFRGLQYGSNYYQGLFHRNNLRASVIEKYDPYENAIAERRNGILKQEFNIARKIKSIDLKRQVIKNAINVYNHQRPHLSNHMLTPEQMHSQIKLKRKQYKSKKLND